MMFSVWLKLVRNKSSFIFKFKIKYVITLGVRSKITEVNEVRVTVITLVFVSPFPASDTAVPSLQVLIFLGQEISER